MPDTPTPAPSPPRARREGKGLLYTHDHHQALRHPKPKTSTIDSLLDSAHLVLRLDDTVYEATWSGTLPGPAGPWANLCGQGVLAEAITSRSAVSSALQSGSAPGLLDRSHRTKIKRPNPNEH